MQRFKYQIGIYAAKNCSFSVSLQRNASQEVLNKVIYRGGGGGLRPEAWTLAFQIPFPAKMVFLL